MKTRIGAAIVAALVAVLCLALLAGIAGRRLLAIAVAGGEV